MAIINFGFNEIKVSKKENVKGKISIKNDVVIKEVSEKDLNLGDKSQSVLEFDFTFSSKYSPNLGEIILEGNLLFMENSNKVKEILSEWNKTKKIPRDIMANILNTILTKCNIEALVLSQKVNLPPPIPLPSVKQNKETK